VTQTQILVIADLDCLTACCQSITFTPICNSEAPGIYFQPQSWIDEVFVNASRDILCNSSEAGKGYLLPQAIWNVLQNNLH
jgi:hypothetical protein